MVSSNLAQVHVHAFLVLALIGIVVVSELHDLMGLVGQGLAYELWVLMLPHLHVG